ncbi:MAG: DNA translocase FtsK 4TM domain-containing protein, partial [Deltaproteobacteria bacterium]|nr:DNA translocase FtsK 4TM domain-containing protein [Deltaproteobacteria bacterium]
MTASAKTAAKGAKAGSGTKAPAGARAKAGRAENKATGGTRGTRATRGTVNDVRAPDVPTIPPEVPSLGAVFLAVVVFLALVSRGPDDYARIGGPGELENYFGAVGAYLSEKLVRFFGVGAFWPVLALLLFPCRALAGPGRSPPLPRVAIGLALAVFSALALLSALISPPLPFFSAPDLSGGGAFGLFLSRGLGSVLGKTGTLIVLPFLFLLGFYLFSGITAKGVFRFLSLFRLNPEEGSEEGSEEGKGKTAGPIIRDAAAGSRGRERRGEKAGGDPPAAETEEDSKAAPEPAEPLIIRDGAKRAKSPKAKGDAAGRGGRGGRGGYGP